MQRSKVESLELEGKKLLEKRDFKGAEKKFSQALELQESTVSRNNLALAIYLQGEAKRALEALKPCLEAQSLELHPNPYTHALAARLFAALGEEEKARQQLKEAIKLFEDGIKELKKQSEIRHSWQEYTISIMRAAGSLGNHRQVFELFRRWEKYHISWENRYLAGIAAFNLGYFTRAASMWASLKEAGEFVMGMQQVAIMVDRGIIPPFKLEYEVYSHEAIKSLMEKAGSDEGLKGELAKNGMVRIMMLSFILHPKTEERIVLAMLETLVAYGDSWGKELAFNLLRANGIATHVKMAAAQALVDCGFLQENEPVSMNIDGEERLVELRKIEISFDPDPEVEKAVQKAKELREKGRLEEAVALLENFMHKNKLHLQLILVLANLYRAVNEPHKALPLLKMMEEVLPHDPVVLFNLSALWLQLGDLQKARQCFEQIDLKGQDNEFKEKYKILKRELEHKGSFITSEDIEEIFLELEEKKRAAIEEKPLPLDASLVRGLKNMPVNWLEGMIEDYQLNPVRLRKEREEEIYRFLCQPRHLKKVLKEDLDNEERELLRYLLEKGGWARLSAVTHRFGSMQGDGFFWEEYIPSSPLGFLWAHGLVLVGRAKIKGRNTKIVTIPLELREIMASALGVEQPTIFSAAEGDKKNKLTRKKILVFRVTLTDLYGRVRGYPYRIIAVPEDFTLFDLAKTIIESFNFAFDHSFGFYDNIKQWSKSVEGYEYFTDLGEGRGFPGVKKTKITKAFDKQGKKMLFLFDYGDEWRFIVHFKEVQDASEKGKYPAIWEKSGDVEQYGPE